MMRSSVVLSLLVGLAGCGGSGFSTPVATKFVTPNADGSIREAQPFLNGADQNDPVYSLNGTGNGYSYRVGIVPDEGIRGMAGVIPGASVTAPPTTGTAQFSGGFNVQFVEIISASSTNIQTSSRGHDRGALDLTADFRARTLTGDRVPRVINTPDGPLPQADLRVDGRFVGRELTGTVTYNGVTGPLQGVMGGNEVIGAFVGQSADQLHAGGFIVN